jgi:ADP-ribosylglycohydrolase
MTNLNLAEYRDKVLGCWTGKSIGGTLGLPFEGKQEMNAIEFYVQKLNGAPAPNDDLDLQLVWLHAAEDKGLYHLTPRLLGEYWMNHVTAPWNEYSVCRLNIASGLYPPLSGSVNNDKWKFSNGAWIRSEIWACLFPGDPDEAIKFAYMDACADHCGEGIYAEMFTAALESSAFVISDIRKLLNIALSKIPADSRVARTVKLVCESYDAGKDFTETRAAVLAENKDLGWFQAPSNLGFLVIGLLYGEGDFGKTLCRAVNCGDDTDCTGATAGSIMGIIRGRSDIPQNWVKPIGETIQTISINVLSLAVPQTLSDLTDRVIRLAQIARAENPGLIKLSEEASEIPEQHLASFTDSKVAELIWARSPYELVFDLPYGCLSVVYEDGPVVESGKEKNITLILKRPQMNDSLIYFKWLLPESWQVKPVNGGSIFAKKNFTPSTLAKQTLLPGELKEPYSYIPLQLQLLGRNNPVIVQVPFQSANMIEYNEMKLFCGDNDIRRIQKRREDASYVHFKELFF